MFSYTIIAIYIMLLICINGVRVLYYLNG